VASLLHHALVDLVRGRPDLAVFLLRRAAGARVPAFSHVRVTDACLDSLQPAHRQADLVLELTTRRRTVLVIAVEIQRRVDRRKWTAWLAYLAALCRRGPACVLVVTPSEQVARWAARPYAVGPGNHLRVWVVGPQQVPRCTDPGQGERHPALALLSAIVHGARDPAGLGAAARALSVVDPGEAEVYCALLSKHLPAPRWRLLEDLVMDLEKYRDLPRPPWLIAIKAEGRAEGQQQGQTRGELTARRAVLLRLAARAGIKFTEAQRRRISACRSVARLDGWIDRVHEVTSARALFAA
jgi:hypothetical protein